MILKRLDLVMAKGLTSSYKKKNKPSERWDVEVFKEGALVSPDMLEALKLLDEKVKSQNGTLFITDLFRSWEVQERNRNDYLTKKKKAFVAPPGGSFHQAGRAVDFSVSELNFKDVPKEQWLRKFWDIAKPLGFHPIIRIPDLGISECWHFDFPGKDWTKVYQDTDKSNTDSLDYSLVAKCCILDVGKWNPAENQEKVKNMYIQAQLIRLGFYEIGDVDGIIGAKTKKVLQILGFGSSPIAEVLSALCKNGS